MALIILTACAAFGSACFALCAYEIHQARKRWDAVMSAIRADSEKTRDDVRRTLDNLSSTFYSKRAN